MLEIRYTRNWSRFSTSLLSQPVISRGALGSPGQRRDLEARGWGEREIQHWYGFKPPTLGMGALVSWAVGAVEQTRLCLESEEGHGSWSVRTLGYQENKKKTADGLNYCWLIPTGDLSPGPRGEDSIEWLCIFSPAGKCNTPVPHPLNNLHFIAGDTAYGEWRFGIGKMAVLAAGPWRTWLAECSS